MKIYKYGVERALVAAGAMVEGPLAAVPWRRSTERVAEVVRPMVVVEWMEKMRQEQWDGEEELGTLGELVHVRCKGEVRITLLLNAHDTSEEEEEAMAEALRDRMDALWNEAGLGTLAAVTAETGLAVYLVEPMVAQVGDDERSETGRMVLLRWMVGIHGGRGGLEQEL